MICRLISVPSTSMKSVITNSSACYLCGKPGTETHHCIFGSKRKLADKDGLTVRLCHSCHDAIHHSPKEFDQQMQRALKKIAQEKWEEKYGSREEFIKRYGKNYLG